jgi:hypothetical protein
MRLREGHSLSRVEKRTACLQRQEKEALLLPVFDIELRSLSEEMTEARMRLGIPDQAVFGTSGFSVRKLQLQVRDGALTVKEGIDFFSLGLRMLGSDIGYSGSLFGRASLGNTLKPREVSVCCLDTCISHHIHHRFVHMVCQLLKLGPSGHFHLSPSTLQLLGGALEPRLE